MSDILDEFSATKQDNPVSAPVSQEPHIEKGPQANNEPDAKAQDFEQQLQEQMAALMGSMDESPEMKREIEAIMQDLATSSVDVAAAAAAEGGKAQGSSARKGPAGETTGSEAPFQETIRKTMERMQASGDQASAAAKADDADDLLAQMMRELQGGGGAGGDDLPDNEEGFNKMLLGMMEQLTNKEILYEPMKELYDKFPGWLQKNRTTTKPEDVKRYEEQQRLVTQIVGRFEKKDYSDDNAADREFIVERMQQVCLPLSFCQKPVAKLLGCRCKPLAVLRLTWSET